MLEELGIDLSKLKRYDWAETCAQWNWSFRHVMMIPAAVSVQENRGDWIGIGCKTCGHARDRGSYRFHCSQICLHPDCLLTQFFRQETLKIRGMTSGRT